jgi:hypothetical protein
MDIQARKLNLIEEFIRITDEKFIEKLESLVKNEKRNQQESELKPMSLNKFHEIIDQARDDKANGRVVSHDDLKKRIKSW